MSHITNPFASPPPESISLSNTPLVRVICQVRFNSVLSIDNRGFVANFQESIRDRYPILNQELTQKFVIGQPNTAPSHNVNVWRFNDIDNVWRVSLATDFVAIETTSYNSRNDFLSRLSFILSAVNNNFKPAIVSRLGIRYIDRITDNAIQSIGTLIKPEFLGVYTAETNEFIKQSINISVFEIPNSGSQLLARWGLVPPSSTIDPNAIESIDKVSWILDLDMFSIKTKPFIVDNIIHDSRVFMEHLYSFFRWVVTDEFIRFYGGDI